MELYSTIFIFHDMCNPCQKSACISTLSVESALTSLRDGIAVKKQSLHDREKRQIPIDKIVLPSWGDLRSYRDKAFEERLVSDLAKEGLLALPIVRLCPDKPDVYECLDGWSRIQGLRELGRQTVECEVVDVDDVSALCLSLKMNTVRKTHDAIGIARTFKLLHDSFGLKYDQIAERFGYNRSWVYKLVSLLNLPKSIQEKVSVGDISITEALEMVSGTYRPDPFKPDKNKLCDFCHGDFEAHEINRVFLCYRCASRLSNLIDEEDRRFRAEMEMRAKQAKEGQKRLVEQ